MEDFFAKAKVFLDNAGYKLITVIAVAILGILVIKKLMKMTKLWFLSSSMDPAVVNFAVTIIKFILALLLVLYCLSMLGVPLSGVVSAISALTLAIGLAVKDLIGSVANGLMLVSTHPFKENDYVEIGGVGGTVKEINLMHTILFTPDNKKVLLPNSQVFSSSIVNYSSNELRRMDLSVSVDYDENPEKVREILLKVANEHPLVLQNPAPACHYNYQNDSAIMFNVRVWTKNADYWTVNWDLNEQLTKTLIKKKIAIPFPQVTVSYRKEAKNG